MERADSDPKNVLVLNCGSTTIKFQLLETRSKDLLIKGAVDRIGRNDCVGKVQRFDDGSEKRSEELPNGTHAQALQWVFNQIPSDTILHGIGHRVVHGGSYFSEAAPINPETLSKIEECIPLAPLHNPVQLAGIRECLKLHPEIPQFASFDTAFHQKKPLLHSIFPLPQELRGQYGYRKFGFHGASHRFVAQRAAEMLGRKLEDLRLVTCHLGGGSSVTAVQGGVAVDTTATFGTFTGMPMGSRSGDLDGGVILDLMMRQNLKAQEVYDILYKKSGLLGLSGVSADMAELEQLEAQGHEGARIARDYYVYALKKFIGAFVAVMGGIDGIVFTAGIGENDPDLRRRVCQDLGWMGVRFDREKNHVKGRELIFSTPDSSVALLVVPTNEELAIALEVSARLG